MTHNSTKIVEVRYKGNLVNIGPDDDVVVKQVLALIQDGDTDYTVRPQKGR